LGYDPGNTDGAESMQTSIAISQFQAENNMQVTGKATPQLAGILSARLSDD
jgi:carboxyl-terminal processing protease